MLDFEIENITKYAEKMAIPPKIGGLENLVLHQHLRKNVEYYTNTYLQLKPLERPASFYLNVTLNGTDPADVIEGNQKYGNII